MDKKRGKVMGITKRLLIMVVSVLLALYSSGIFAESRSWAPPAKLASDNYWDHVLNHYGIPLLQFWITSVYRLYIKLTLFNMFVFGMKYLPSGIYLYKFVKSVYCTSRERLKIKQMELEDLVLEIAMVKTKQCLRETECVELMSQQEREAARLRQMRAKVQALISGDEALCKLLENFAIERPNFLHAASDDFDLMEFLAHDKSELADRLIDVEDPHMTVSEKSEYSSLSEAEVEKDCQIKIIEVTNVYKVAYLKHYIKQKRIRRASRHATLKKKMSNIKKLLESWQKALNMVMKDHHYILRRERDETSEDISASRPHDSDTDTPIDEYHDWDQSGLYKNYYQEPEIRECTEDYPCNEYNENYYGNSYEEIETVYEELESKYEAQTQSSRQLPRLMEETSSQLLALQDLTLDRNESSDMIAL